MTGQREPVLTIGAVDTGVLVVAEEKAAVALTLVAAHGIDTDLLAAAVVVLTLVHICEKRKRRGQERSHLELQVRRGHLEGHGCHQFSWLQSDTTEVPLGGTPQWYPPTVLHGVTPQR